MATDLNSRVDLILPDLGVPDAVVGAWYALPGDHVYLGERVVEVIVNGATFDVTSPATGTLLERSALPGDHIKSGAILGAVAPDPE